MANYTPNYGLHQWIPEDVFVRTDFNTDLSKIDAGLKAAQDTANSAASAAATAQSTANTANTNAAAAQSTANGKTAIVTGSYEGDGKTSKTITLGFQAKAVLVTSQSGIVNTTYHCYGGLALPGKPCYHRDMNAIEITSSGFKVAYKDEGGTSVATNQSNTTYFYIAFR